MDRIYATRPAGAMNVVHMEHSDQSGGSSFSSGTHSLAALRKDRAT
jgi:hypothetical protein